MREELKALLERACETLEKMIAMAPAEKPEFPDGSDNVGDHSEWAFATADWQTAPVLRTVVGKLRAALAAQGEGEQAATVTYRIEGSYSGIPGSWWIRGNTNSAGDEYDAEEFPDGWRMARRTMFGTCRYRVVEIRSTERILTEEEIVKVAERVEEGGE